MLVAARAAGIRAFDTASHYGAGLSERRIGEFLAGRPREEFTVCTKAGRRLVPAQGDVQGAEGFYHSRHFLPLHPHTPRTLGRAGSTLKFRGCVRW
jgi:aryl-alcohol dehydrogenase-like predicted oxidoreductase